MAKKTGKKPYKFRQARKDAKAGAKGVFTGKRKAAVKDITTKQTLEEREALKELSDARKRQKAGKADFIVDDRGQRVDVKPTETARERFARDRAEARRRAYEMYPEDETELDKQKARKARMEAKNKAAIAKQEADRAANRGRNAPTLQQTPANEKPLSRPVKKAAVKKGTVGTTKKPDAKGIDKVVKEAKAAAAKNKPQIKKAVAEAKAKKYPNAKPIGTISFKDGKMAFKPAEGFNELGKRRLDQMKKAGISEADAKKVLATNKPAYEKKMTRAEKSAANKAAWKNMSPAERKNWAANKPAAKTAPIQSVTNVQPEKAGKGTTKPKFVQKKTPAKKAVVKPSTSKELVVRPKGAVATTAKKATTTAAKKGGVAGVLKGAGRVAGKLVGGRVGAALAVGAAVAGPLHKALSKDTKGRTTFDVLQKRADAVVAADKKKQLPKRPAGAMPKGGGKGATGSKLVSGTGVGAGGSSYTVKKGDTLSAIAKSNNTTLAAIREANPKLMKNKKYKQGNVIFSGTKVKLPKK